MYRYTIEQLTKAAEESLSVAEVCRRIGIEKPGGSTQTNIRNRLRLANIDTSHFLGQGRQRGIKPNNRRSASEILCYSSSSRRERASALRRALIEIGRNYCCILCGNNGKWQNKPLILEVHHKDGNWLNNQADNLDFACPSCHQLLDRGS